MKERLDVILVQKGLAPSREKAKTTIMAGLVTVDGRIEDKAGQKFDTEQTFEVKEQLRYVSRGGLKLEKAVDEFNIDLNGAICVDMGASTGGFTDCMLQNGAAKVYAIDVGYGQLDYKLRIDSRVVNIEKTNIRYLDTALIKEEADLITIDVSFISLALILPVAEKVLARDGHIVCLIKPQFEAGREQVGKNGIVRNSKVHKEVILNVTGYARECGLAPAGLTFSPVKGTKGNIEYLLYLKRFEKTGTGEQEAAEILAEAGISPDNVISRAYDDLNRHE